MSRDELMVAVLVAWMLHSCNEAAAVAGMISRRATVAARTVILIARTLGAHAASRDWWVSVPPNAEERQSPA